MNLIPFPAEFESAKFTVSKLLEYTCTLKPESPFKVLLLQFLMIEEAYSFV